MADKLISGTHDRGERSASAKLTDADVAEIRRLAATAMTHVLIAERFPVDRRHIGRILNGSRWLSAETACA